MLACVVKQMNPAAHIGVRAAFLVSVLGPILALVLYPRAKWLFAFALIGLALVILQLLTEKEPTPQEIAERAERILSGTYGAWDVDDYEHLNPKTPAVHDLWRSTMSVGGLPEEWVRLDEAKQSEIREIIGRLREMQPQPSRQLS
jgi:hypothetical protein